MAFGFLATPDSLTFTNLQGKTITISSTHEEFAKAKEIVKEIQVFINDGLESQYLKSLERLEQLVAPAKKITESGEIKIENGVLYYEGVELHNTLTERILWGMREGFNMNPYIAFLKNLMQNPSYRSVEQLFTFMEAHKMGISDDGFILGYKRVRDDFKDIYTGTMDNSPGKVVHMKRNQVSDDPTATCSKGLHFCAIQYLPSYGNDAGNKIVIVKVNPKDIVSVPIDHDAAKVRCCEYLVLSEYTGSDKDDLLASKPVFTNTDWGNDDYDDYDDVEDDDDLNDNYEGDDDLNTNYTDVLGDLNTNYTDVLDDFVVDGDGYSMFLQKQNEQEINDVAVEISEPEEVSIEEAPAPVAPQIQLDLFGRPDTTENLEKLFKDL